MSFLCNVAAGQHTPKSMLESFEPRNVILAPALTRTATVQLAVGTLGNTGKHSGFRRGGKGGGGLQRTWLLTRPMAPLTGDISQVGAVHPETIGPHCLAMLPRSNTSSCGAATTLQVALHGRKGRRAACACTGARCAPNALHALRCPKYTEYAEYAKWRNRRVAAFILGARSPRNRPRARARYLKKRAASFFTRGSLEQKCENFGVKIEQT